MKLKLSPGFYKVLGMDKDKGMEDSAQTPHNQIDNIRLEEGREVGGLETNEEDEVRPRVSGSDGITSGGAITEQFGRSKLDPNKVQGVDPDAGNNQTMGIP